MKATSPHFLLFSESSRKDPHGEWRFVLQSIDGTEQIEAADAEPDAKGERLELLAVVRGLEALPQPARVTLVTPSKYVNRGLAYGLKEWRANGWQWEHFGEMVPIKNRDLWQRVDRALEFHRLECRAWRFDLPHALIGPHEERYDEKDERREDAGPDVPPLVTRRAVNASALRARTRAVGSFTAPARPAVSSETSGSKCPGARIAPTQSLSRRLRTRTRLFKRWTNDKREGAWLKLAQLGTQLLPLPWFE